jgi:hypothetical protein
VTLVDGEVRRPEHAAQVDNLLFVDVLVLGLSKISVSPPMVTSNLPSWRSST